MRLLRRMLAALMVFVLVAAGVFHARSEYLINRPVPALARADARADAYYFAYGTNMSSRYLFNVRDIRAAQSQPGRVDQHEIVFLGPGVNALEPAFAYLVKAETKTAHGVLHRLTREDLEKIRNSERAQYEWSAVPVVTADGSVVSAHTLWRAAGPAGIPSRRYLNLLV